MWQLKIKDPSGHTRVQPLNPQWSTQFTLGYNTQNGIPLKDPYVPKDSLTVWRAPESNINTQNQLSPYWIKSTHEMVVLHLADLAVREAQLPTDMPIRVGDTEICLETTDLSPTLPPQPKSVKSWLTATEDGKQLLWMAKKAASTPLSIYLEGETGTGKEVLAHLLHAWSERSSGPFIPINCGALPTALAESELFGHVKGAFTGAHTQRPGALIQAHNGTLFLDEIGDLPLDIQVKLLRFLENGEIKPVGADHSSRADVRILCATHLPLKKLVETGKFRRDLFYRLASVTLQIPPLRTRLEDIALLAKQFAIELGRSLSPRALLRLQAHAWPGNVRELRHAIERASGNAGPFNQILTEEHFDFLLNPETVADRPELELGGAILSLEEMERALILKALRISRGNRSKAADILGIARSTLFEMLKRHKIPGPRTALTLK